MTHYFARRTPAPPDGKLVGQNPRVTLEVSKERTEVQASVSDSELSHFVSGEVRSVSREAEHNLRKTWKIQIGPFAEHVVQLERRSATSKIITLTIDGQVLCEASAEDIESRGDCWECNFRFLGEKYLEWIVHNCNSEGAPLDSKGSIVNRTAFSHHCVVTCGENIEEASLTIDGRDFGFLADA